MASLCVAGAGDERAGFERLQLSHVRDRRLGRVSDQLAADVRFGVRIALHQDFKGERQQGIACKDCRPFVISLVHGRLTATHVVAVTGGLMHERIAVDSLDGGSRVHGLCRWYAEQCCTPEHQKGTKTLAARENGVVHGGAEARAARPCVASGASRRPLGEARHSSKPLHNDH